MGLFDSIAGAVGNALGQGENGNGAENILNSILQQGAGGQSGNIVGQLLGGLFGGQEGQGGQGGQDGAAGGSPLSGILETLASSGLADQVGSWLSNNPNLPITPDQLREALGSEQVQQLAQQSGLPIGEFLKHLAEHLPQAASDSAGMPSA